MQKWENSLYEMFAEERPLPASAEERLAESYAAVRAGARGKDMCIHMNTANERKKRSLRVLAIAAACALVLGVGAMALGSYTDFFHKAFGTGIDSRESYTVAKPGGGEEVYPAVERADVDPAAAEALLGASVAPLGQSVTVGAYSFTAESLAMDENGNGVLTITVENPQGLGLKEDGVYHAYEGEFQPFVFSLSQGGQTMSTTELPVSEGRSDTKAGYVLYFAGLGEAGSLTLEIAAWNGSFDEAAAAELNNGQVCPLYDEGSLLLPAAEAADAQGFAGDGLTAELSPVGLELQFEAGDDGGSFYRELILRYANGEEYTVKSEEPYIINEMKARANEGTVWLVFNQLVAPEEVESISIAGYYNGAAYEQTLTPSGN